MESRLVRAGFRRAIASSYNPAKRRVVFQQQPRRLYASPSEPSGPVRAASPISFNDDPDQFSRPRAELIPDQPRNSNNQDGQDYEQLLRRVRIVPASPSYFTARPQYTDDLLSLSTLLRKHMLLPRLPRGDAPRPAWKTIQQYKTEIAEPVQEKGFSMLMDILRRLNCIHPSVMPVEVERAMARFKRHLQPISNKPKPIVVDELGRARAVGRRKTSEAIVFLVEGEGECLVNGRSLTDYFGRLHDRESAMWPLKATQRLDKYNVWTVARGGGTTGQAEAITLGVAKALMAHEPALKSALRKAGCLQRDTRVVERKKPGKLKARKMPAWVKR